MNKLTQGATRLLVLALGLGLATTGWADTLRVLGDDVVIHSNATDSNRSGYAITTGSLSFNTPSGCSAGDSLLFTKLQMISEGSQNNYTYAQTITITVGDKTYTSGKVVGPANESIGNLGTKSVLTYNFPNVPVQAGSSYAITFNNAGSAGIRYGVENTNTYTGYTISLTGSTDNWHPYGAITATKVLSTSPDVGDKILLSNTATSGSLQASPNAECNFAVTIPATLGLPSGAIISVKKLNFASWNDTMVKSSSSQCDPYGIYLNAQRSYNLKGNTTYSNTDPGTIDLTGAKIQATATTSANRLSFAFVDGYIPQLTVGTTYAQADGNGDKANSGKGVTFLHYNGNQNSGGSTDYCSIRYVSADSGVISTSTAQGYYPVYEMYAEVVSIPTETATISAAGTHTLAGLFTSVSSSGRYTINVNESATLNIDAATTVSALTLNVASGKTLTVTGSALTVASALRVTGEGYVNLTGATVSGTLKGDGTVVYTGTATPSGLVFTDTAWEGTLWLENKTGVTAWEPTNYGNANSTIRMTGIQLYFNTADHKAANVSFDGTLEVTDTYSDGTAASYGIEINNGFSDATTTFGALRGTGTIQDTDQAATPLLVFNDASEFTGTIKLSYGGKKIRVGTSNDMVNAGELFIASGKSVTVSSGKTWTASGGFYVLGTLTLGGTGSTLSGKVSGSGTVVCNQVDLSGSGFNTSANYGWTGKVRIAGDTMSPTTYFDESVYGNADSTLEIVSGHVEITEATSLPGTVNVASGATLYMTSSSITDLAISGTNSGTVNLQMASSLTTLTLGDGIARGTVVYPSSLTTLNVALTETLADDGVKSFTCGSATPTAAVLTLTRADGTTTNVTGTISGSTVSFAWTPAVAGKACWIDYEMEYESGNASKTGWENSGTDTAKLHSDSSIEGANAFNEDTGMLYTYAHPYKNDMVGDKAYPDTWTAVVRCTVPNYADAAVITFGWNTGFIGLIAGETPDSEMRVVQSTGGNHYVTNAVMTVQNATKAQHVYIFTVETNQSVTVYCDASLVTNVVYATPFTIATKTASGGEGGFQIGSILGGQAGGVIRFAKNESPASTLSEEVQKDARIDCVRLYKGVLGPNAIAQLSEEFPAVKLFEATIDGGDDNEWATLGWTGGDISTLNQYSKIILTVTDDATLTLPSEITAEDFFINVAAGKTLTLNQGSGVTLNLTHPMEVNGGAIAFSGTDIKLGSTVNIGGTGTVKFGNGMVINEALSGAAKVEIASGDTVAVVSGGSIANPLTGAGTLTYEYATVPASALSFSGWTGTVQLPAIASGGIIFNNYGTTGSTVYLTSMSGAWINPDYTTINPKLYLAGNMTLAAMSTRTYTFAEIDGPGALSFATSEGEPTVNITKVAEGYSGTISSTLGNPVTIATLDRAAGTTVTPGSKVLSTSSGVQASALTVGGAATGIVPVFVTDGLYVKAASVTKNDTTTYYDTVSAATTAAGTDAATIKLLMPTDGAVTLAPGQTLINGNLASGGVTGPNGYEVVNNNGTYTLVDNTAATWTDASGDHSWTNAQNWSTGYIPSQYTAVTFPASESAHVVGLSLNNASSESARHHCASMTLNGDVTFQRAAAGTWAYVQVYGSVSGSGTLTFLQTGLRVPTNGSATISCPVVCNAASNDNFFSGSDSGNETFTFSGAVDVVAGELKADYSHLIFSGPVTIRNGAYIKSNGNSTADTTFDGGIIVPADAAASLTLANNGGAHTIASTVTLAVGATLTIPNSTVTNDATFVASAQGYHVVSAAGGGDTTVYSVEVIPSSVEIGAATFDYGVDFTNATVTVAVTETNASGVEYTLTIGGKDYTANADGGTAVTFNNVEVPRGAAYGSVSYDITSTASSTTGATSGSATVEDVAAGWINENATTHGLASAGGSWTNADAVTYSEGKAAISDNRFVATTASTASRVVLAFEVCFSSTSEDDVSGEAQAAIKLGAVNDATTFMVLTTGNTWTPVSNAELPIDASATYDVVLTIDYGTNTYKVDVEGNALTNSAGSASFSLATSKATVQNIDFVGSGTLTSMKGDQIEGYMVVDKNGTRYASISAAITAYLADPTIAPLRVLHDGTAPSGWKIVTEGGIDILKKAAKGLFFMAY